LTNTTGDVVYGSGSNAYSNLTAPTVLGNNLGWNGTNVFWQSARNTMYLYDEFMTADNTGTLNWFVNGSGSGGVLANTTYPSTAGHPGIFAMSCTTSGDAHITLGANSGGTFVFGGGAISQTWIAQLSALSDGTDTYIVRMGFTDAYTGTPGNGAYFAYTHSANSGKWQVATASSSSSTVNNTNNVADTNFHSFRIEINAGATSVGFYIDDVQVANSPISTNIPSSVLYPWVVMIKSAGTNGRAMVCDAFTMVQEFTTPR
jgi:hypothetical protein